MFLSDDERAAIVAADPALKARLRDKYLRAKVRLGHSMAADVEIAHYLNQMKELGAAGVEAQLTSESFDEAVGVSDR